MAIRKVWLQQPMAFARAGGSPTSVSAFRWSEPDLRPRGSGRTTIIPDTTFDVDDTGALVLRDEAFVLFKDEKGIRPVSPFFELHGDWDGRAPAASTQLTESVLREQGLSLKDIVWEIRHANHKAYALTHSDGDRIEAQLRFRGDDHAPQELRGRSSAGASHPLLPPDKFIPMGRLRAIRPTEVLPQIRLRFEPPPGFAYAPRNFAERVRTGGKSANPFAVLFNRISTLIPRNKRWKTFTPPPERCILDETAAWPQYRLLTYGQVLRGFLRAIVRPGSAVALLRAFSTQSSEALRFWLGPLADVGKLPPGLYASWIGGGSVLSSLGIIDDLGDGIITCTVGSLAPAYARIVVAPPHFSPDRRPPVTIADVLVDKEAREDARKPDWATGKNFAPANAEVEDLLDRAHETASASNLDAWAVQRAMENGSAAVYRGDKVVPPNPGAPIWPDLASQSVMDLPLFRRGSAQHHRNSAYEIFEQMARDQPHLVSQWIRDQDDPLSAYYDRKMPALMRGSDRHPLHFTRRQFEAFRRWFEAMRARKLEEDAEDEKEGVEEGRRRRARKAGAE